MKSTILIPVKNNGKREVTQLNQNEIVIVAVEFQKQWTEKSFYCKLIKKN